MGSAQSYMIGGTVAAAVGSIATLGVLAPGLFAAASAAAAVQTAGLVTAAGATAVGAGMTIAGQAAQADAVEADSAKAKAQAASANLYGNRTREGGALERVIPTLGGGDFGASGLDAFATGQGGAVQYA